MRYTRPVAAGVVVAVAALALLAGQGAFARLAAPEAGSGAAPGRAGTGQQATAGRPASAPTPKAEAHLAEETVKQYGRLGLSADGFLPGEGVTVAVKPEGSAEPIELGRVQADDQGRIGEFAADLPDGVTSGPRAVTVAGAASGRRATTILYVRAEKTFAVLNTYTPRPTDKLGFVVGGFEPGEQVQVFLRDTTGAPLATVPTDQAGNTAWTEVETPVVQPGQYDLIFQGSQGKNSYVQRITVSPLTPTLELSPWAGPPGSSFELNGRGFLAGEDVQVFVGRGQQPATTFEADQYGSFWGIGPLVVPVEAGAGQAEVRLIGQRSGAEVTQSFTVVGGKPWAELSAYSGMPGTVVRFSGGGFGARERVTVHLGNAGGPVVATAQTDERGNVVRSDSAAVPSDPTATSQTTVTFTMVGEASRSEASAAFTVVAPAIPSFGGERPRSP